MNKSICVSSRYILLAVDKSFYYWYKGGHIYISKEEKDKKTKLPGSLFFKKNIFKRLFSHSRLLSRIFRLYPRAVIKDNNHFYFCFDSSIYCFDAVNGVRESHRVRENTRTPLNLTLATTSKGSLLMYGEYGWNEGSDEVRIVGTYDRSNWKTLFVFPPKTIRHIHNIIWDNEKNVFIILTGDNDEESGFIEIDSDFTSFKKVLFGKQKFRSCFAFKCKGKYYYATDTPLEKNYLFRIDEQQIVPVCGLSGSAIFSYEQCGKWYFSTSVEQDPNLPFLLHCLSNKKAPGIFDYYSRVYLFNEFGNAIEIYREKKDILPMWLFQFGNISFCKNYRNNILYLIPIATKNSFKTIKIETGKTIL